jgi:hypothetical protein
MLLYFVRLPQFLVFLRTSPYKFIDIGMRNLSFIYYTKCKDTWGGPRNPTGGMCSGSRGSFPL